MAHGDTPEHWRDWLQAAPPELAKFFRPERGDEPDQVLGDVVKLLQEDELQLRIDLHHHHHTEE